MYYESEAMFTLINGFKTEWIDIENFKIKSYNVPYLLLDALRSSTH